MDIRKLQWMNGEYMKALAPDIRRARCREALEARGLWKESTSRRHISTVCWR
jgi:hypothetical protein